MNRDEKLRRLRRQMSEHGLKAWIVPSADPHQSEYPAARWQIRAWLSGFDGSAGTLVVTESHAGLWVDARYHMRAETELAGSEIQPFKMGRAGVPDYAEWLVAELPAGATVGLDGTLFAARAVDRLQQTLAAGDIHLTDTGNLVDGLWPERPPLPDSPVSLYDDQFAGATRADKLARVRAALAAHGADAQLIATLDDIAWTLNIRGQDVPYNPVALAYLLITPERAELFIDPVKIPPVVATALAAAGVTVAPYPALPDRLTALPATTTVLLDPARTNFRLRQLLAAGCRLQSGTCIPTRLKSIKNETELAGSRRAHVRDGVALVRWLYWLSQQPLAGEATEITLGDRLTAFRRQGEHFRDLSFPNIIAYGANSAVGHYRPRPATTPLIRRQGMLLFDTGAHYLDGTTDTTRTICLGPATARQKSVYTRVLQSHIALARARFPRGTSGQQLDVIARTPLWAQGWQCRHGIGHGIGHYLNVHEGPQRISSKNHVPLQPGMTITNEPGVYFEGEFGVRLENVVVVQPAQKNDFATFYGFETISCCPFSVDLVLPELLSHDERVWLDNYHRFVYTQLAPHLPPAEMDWLRRETRPLP